MFYAVGDKEFLSAKTPEEAVDEFMEDIENIDDVDFPIVVDEYEAMNPFYNKKWLAKGLLEDFILRLDEEYGSPYESTEITDGMRKAALDFIDVIQKEYRVWAHGPTGKTFEFSKEDVEKRRAK